VLLHSVTGKEAEERGSAAKCRRRAGRRGGGSERRAAARRQAARQARQRGARCVGSSAKRPASVCRQPPSAPSASE